MNVHNRLPGLDSYLQNLTERCVSFVEFVYKITDVHKKSDKHTSPVPFEVPPGVVD